MEDNNSRKEFILKGKDDRLYNLMILNEQDEITFKSNIIDNIWGFQYILNLDLAKFYYINKNLRKYDSIKEIFLKYFNDIKEEQISIFSNDNKIIVYFSDNDIVEKPFILEPNEMKTDDIIRKLCDKMKDIDALKTELDKQKIENDNLRNELIKRRSDDEKNISEIRKEIENLKTTINNICQKALYGNKLENKEKEFNQIKENIEKFDKNKKYSEYKKIDEISDKNEFSILQEKDLESKIEDNKEHNEKNKTKIEISDFILDEYEDNIGDRYQLKFEKNEIKHNLNIKEAKYIYIDDIKITNRSDKRFTSFYMVIDMNNSSKNVYFFNNQNNHAILWVTPQCPLLRWYSCDIGCSFYIENPKIGEYTIYIYLREKSDGDNLSLPLKITFNIIEDTENFERKEEKGKEEKKQEDDFKREEDNKRIQEKKGNIKYKAEEMLNELNEEFNIYSFLDKEEALNKIIELNYDRVKINDWVLGQL